MAVNYIDTSSEVRNTAIHATPWLSCFAYHRPGVFPDTSIAWSVKEDGVLLILL